jgi:hypothetical protein
MNMPEVRCFLSLADGSVVRVPPGDPRLAEVRAKPSAFAAIEAVPSRIQYQWLDDFIRQVEDTTVRARMEAAINGKGAFRRFKDILLTLPDERRRWFEFRDEKMRERIVEWVREQGVSPVNEPAWTAAPVPAARESTANSPTDVDALRDLLIEWADGKDARALQPLALEALAQHIAEHFKLKPRS